MLLGHLILNIIMTYVKTLISNPPSSMNRNNGLQTPLNMDSWGTVSEHAVVYRTQSFPVATWSKLLIINEGTFESVPVSEILFSWWKEALSHRARPTWCRCPPTPAPSSSSCPASLMNWSSWKYHSCFWTPCCYTTWNILLQPTTAVVMVINDW